MKRSDINRRIDEAIAFFAERKFALPPFAHWTPGRWRAADTLPLRRARLGWDITDFGSGNFERTGLLLFTLRNGAYAEKIMIVGEEQVTPFHFHWKKTEDIINRGGGNLIVELHQADSHGDYLDDGIVVSSDGSRLLVPPGGRVVLTPGKSVTLPPSLYHKFYAEAGKGKVMAGEVSTFNDDEKDNRFKEKIGRFASVEEDEAPRYLLCNEYSDR